MPDETTTVTLLGGPLDGFDYEAETIDENVWLYFNSRDKGRYLQHLYRLDGKDSSSFQPVYVYVDDEESNLPGGLARAGIDVPSHAFRE